MARFYGKVGYRISAETVSSVWKTSITERAYFGDILNETSMDASSDKVNDDIRLSERISIVADAYAIENYSLIRYVERDGVLWEVTSVQTMRPRLILTVGGVYNGPVPGSTP